MEKQIFCKNPKTGEEVKIEWDQYSLFESFNLDDVRALIESDNRRMTIVKWHFCDFITIDSDRITFHSMQSEWVKNLLYWLGIPAHIWDYCLTGEYSVNRDRAIQLINS